MPLGYTLVFAIGRKLIPKEFAEIVPPHRYAAVKAWWSSLHASIQGELMDFYEHGDAVLIAARNIHEELDRRDRVDMEADDIRDLSSFDFPNQDYYENLVGNEVYLCLRGPVFHICTAHKKLRAFLLLGVLPQTFACFIHNGNCDMVKQLNTGGIGYWRLRCAST